MRRAAFVLMLLGTPAFAQDLAPEVSVKPELAERSEAETTATTNAETGAENGTDADVVAPKVSAKPEAKADQPETGEPAAEEVDADPQDGEAEAEGTSDAESTEDETEAQAEPLEPGMRDQLRETDEDYAACLTALDRAGVTYTEIDPITPEDDRDCGILRPIEVTEAAPGIALSPAATLRCETALALSDWTRDFVLPAAKRLEERGTLTAIQNGPGYVCRRRNGTSDGKPSEHSFGNALDIMGFGFDDDSSIAVEPREAEGSIEEAFQDAVRASACMEFTTVLGPGSNAAHDNHLHLDVLARSSGWRLCETAGAEAD